MSRTTRASKLPKSHAEPAKSDSAKSAKTTTPQTRASKTTAGAKIVIELEICWWCTKYTRDPSYDEWVCSPKCKEEHEAFAAILEEEDRKIREAKKEARASRRKLSESKTA